MTPISTRGVHLINPDYSIFICFQNGKISSYLNQLFIASKISVTAMTAKEQIQNCWLFIAIQSFVETSLNQPVVLSTDNDKLTI